MINNKKMNLLMPIYYSGNIYNKKNIQLVHQSQRSSVPLFFPIRIQPIQNLEKETYSDIPNMYSVSDISNIYIKSDDNILDICYSQFMINFLANDPSGGITNSIYYKDISYIIYNFTNPIPEQSEIKIYIDDISLNVGYVQFMNNWRSGRKSSNDFSFNLNTSSTFNEQIYNIFNYPELPTDDEIITELVDFMKLLEDIISEPAI